MKDRLTYGDKVFIVLIFIAFAVGTTASYCITTRFWKQSIINKNMGGYDFKTGKFILIDNKEVK